MGTNKSSHQYWVKLDLGLTEKEAEEMAEMLMKFIFPKEDKL